MILKAPENPQNFSRRTLYTSAARVGFRQLLESLRHDKRPILIPAYIGITDREGSGVFDPIEMTETVFEFYTLDDRLSPDMEELESKIKGGRHKAVLVIHYFGFAQTDMPRVSTLCQENGCLLIEDCAHTMRGRVHGQALGSFGDFCFHSIHKCLPTREGGSLTINRPDIQMDPNIKSEEQIEHGTLCQLLNARWDEIDQIRLENYNCLLSCLENREGLTVMYPNLAPGIIPMNFPVLVNGGRREELYFNLMKKNLPTIALYYRLIEPISPEMFPRSHFLSRNILNLPTHQDTTKFDLEMLVDGLNTALEEPA